MVNQRQPYDEPAERAVLGACFLSDLAAEDVTRILTADDFHILRHKAIYAAIVDELTEHRRIDMLAVHRRINGIEVDLAYLHELQNSTPTISNAVHHAEAVAGHKVRRDLIHAAAQISQLGMEAVEDPADAAQRARDILATIDMPAGRGAPDPDVDTFTNSVDTTYDWLIPDFLERRDRMLVTAGEGHGKSVLLAQIAVMTAAGIHPWTHRQMNPRNVLLVDLENGPRLVTRRLADLRRHAKTLDPQRLRVHTRPDGIDLTTRGDRRWLIDRCEANATELLVIGPAYRMSSGVAERGDVGGEDHARKITKALDEIRTVCNVTLLLETHAPHGDQYGSRNLRPFGSTVWLRWPEFGVGIRPDKEDPYKRRYTFEHWRGPRDERRWPVSLERGGQWPWTPTMPSGSFGQVSA